MTNGSKKTPIKRLLPAFGLIRPLNLAFIALTQYLLFFHFLFPLLAEAGVTPLLEGWRAWAFLLATTSVAAAGYAINDYYDLPGDRINKPRKWWKAQEAPAAHARWMAIGPAASGALLSAWIAWDIGAFHLWTLYPIAIGLLWAYSRYGKALPLAGNLLIAALCAMVAGIVWFAEREGFSQLAAQKPGLAKQSALALLFYLGFAFLSTLFREIVKDCEDLKGDAAIGKKTLPVAFGLNPSRWMVFALGVLLELALAGMSVRFFQQSNWLGGTYTATLLALPMAWGLYLLSTAKAPVDFSPVSRLAKWVIFAGVLLILLLP